MRRNAVHVFVLLGTLVLVGCAGADSLSRAPTPTPTHHPSHPAAPLGVYIGTTDGAISALDPADGSVRWRYRAACGCVADVQALENGLVYVGVSPQPGGPSVGTTLLALDASDGAVRWQATTRGAGKVTAVVKDVAYITAAAPSDDPAQHNELQARDADDGSLLWRTQVEGTGDLADKVAGETIYLASFDSRRFYYNEHRWTAFYALNAADGAIRWHRTLGLSDAILAVADGQLYAMEGLTDVVCSSTVSALDAGVGTERWAFPTDAQGGRACTDWIGAERDLVYGLTARGDPPAVRTSLYALDAADGSRRWQVDLPTDAHGAILADGRLYLPEGDALAAYNVADGSLLWQVQGESGPVFSLEGRLYSSRWGQSVDALDPATGALRWRYQTGNYVYLAAATDGTLIGVGTYPFTDSVWHQDIVALSASTGRLLWRFPLGTSEDTPLVG